eukprot:scaffold174225_cov21-Tisochrysis_lutea.AAC.1
MRHLAPADSIQGLHLNHLHLERSIKKQQYKGNSGSTAFLHPHSYSPPPHRPSMIVGLQHTCWQAHKVGVHPYQPTPDSTDCLVACSNRLLPRNNPLVMEPQYTCVQAHTTSTPFTTSPALTPQHTCWQAHTPSSSFSPPA